jgi:hypothetical protein
MAAVVGLDLVRDLFRHERIRHPMLVTGVSCPVDPARLEAAVEAKYPGHEIPLNIHHEDPDFLSAERFVEASDTMHVLADLLSWRVNSTDDDMDSYDDLEGF